MRRAELSPFLPPRRSNLAIVGSHPSVSPSVFSGDVEVWAFNNAVVMLPRVDIAFQMHQEVDWGGQYYRNWLKTNLTAPVYMREMHAEIPMSCAYPFEDVYALTHCIRHRDRQLKYFTSSVAWALALAVQQDRRKIDVYGVDLNEREYPQQKDCFAFWMGFAGGRGIELNIHCADNIFDKPLYGAQALEL